MGSSVRYDGHVTLPFRLPVHAEVLGTVNSVELAGRDLALAWPRRLGEDRQLAQPDGVDADIPWGHWQSEQLSYVDAAAVSFNVEDGTGEERKATVAALSQAFEPWFAIAWDWIVAWSGCPWREANERVSSQISVRTAGPDAFEAFDARGGNVSVRRGVRVNTPDSPRQAWEFFSSSSFSGSIISSTGLTGVTAEQLRGALQRASRQDRLPSPHRLLLSARQGLFEGDYRRAAIDAGTAAEVALGTAVTEALEALGVPAAFVERTVLGANGLAGLVDVARSLGIDPAVSKARAADRIASVRNRAAHAGRSPDRQAAVSAVLTARSIVYSVAPVPAH